MTIIYQNFGEPDLGPGIDSLIPSYLGLRIMFTDPMWNDTALIDIDNYGIIALYPDVAASIDILSATAESNVECPTYIDLELSDSTFGGEYQLDITPSLIQTCAYEPIVSNVSAEFAGVTNTPEVLSVIATSRTTMRVIFTKVMAINEALKNNASYLFTDNLKVLKVEVDSMSSVILTTTPQISAHIYELTVG